MNTEMMTFLQERIKSGLQRSTIASCSEWAEAYRIMGQPFPGPFSFTYHPWSYQIHNDNTEMLIGQKAAQMAFTEVALNKTFYAIDIEGKSVLYVLPATNPDASDFSTSRFDPALEKSDHLRNLFSNVKNVGHKRAGSASLFVRGSRSRSQLKSIPVSMIIFDEVDEMPKDNITLAMERTSGQMDKQYFFISTPTIPGAGVNKYYESSSQNHFFFTCPACSRYIQFLFPESLVITANSLTDLSISDSHLICHECKAILPHESKPDFITLDNSEWVPEYTDRPSSGYTISQLYSMTEHPSKIASSFLRAEINPSDEQEFHNSKIGKPHVVKGARINIEDIDACIKEYKKFNRGPPNSLITLGVDVGKYIHYEIDQWFFDKNVIPSRDINLLSIAKLLTEGYVDHFEQLDLLLREFRVSFTVIDANPERRKSLEFCQRHYGRSKMCFYGRGMASKQISIHPDKECSITVDRTSWMDLSFSRFKGDTKRIQLPLDTSRDYKQHMQAPVRVYSKDQDGNEVGRYKTPENVDDHLSQCRVYSEIALNFAGRLARNQNITGAM